MVRPKRNQHFPQCSPDWWYFIRESSTNVSTHLSEGMWMYSCALNVSQHVQLARELVGCEQETTMGACEYTATTRVWCPCEDLRCVAYRARRRPAGGRAVRAWTCSARLRIARSRARVSGVAVERGWHARNAFERAKSLPTVLYASPVSE